MGRQKRIGRLICIVWKKPKSAITEKSAKTLDLFHTQEEAPGMVFWHEKGWAIYQQVEQYIREKLRVNGYGEVKTPQIVDRSFMGKIRALG